VDGGFFFDIKNKLENNVTIKLPKGQYEIYYILGNLKKDNHSELDKLTKLTLTIFKTKNVKNMGNMFCTCSKSTKLNFSNY
jgi:hypothetical protein